MTELLLRRQQNVVYNLMDHPVFAVVVSMFGMTSYLLSVIKKS